MSESTKIEWATSTGNPWIGCTKVSPGCKNCYAAEMDANRFSKTMGGGTKAKPVTHWGKGAPRFKTKGFWKDARKWDDEACVKETEADAMGFGPYPKPRIFPSLCDWLDEEVPIEWLADFLKLIHDTPNLDWLLLTKRPENWKARMFRASHAGVPMIGNWMQRGECPANIWIGVSVEDQKRADERIPLLLQIPAKVRFLSVEPLLESVQLHLDDAVTCHHCGNYRHGNATGALDICTCPEIHWVIVGGESGKDRRDCGEQAIISVAQQCQAAKVPCFVKQDCAFKPGQQGRLHKDIWSLKQFPTT